MLKEQRTTAMHKAEEGPMEDHTVSLNRVDLHYRTIGDGPVLFLVPPAREWLPANCSALSAHWRSILDSSLSIPAVVVSGRPADPTHMGSVDMATRASSPHIATPVPAPS
jgi:proline iminopeptidase